MILTDCIRGVLGIHQEMNHQDTGAKVHSQNDGVMDFTCTYIPHEHALLKLIDR